MVTSEKGIAIIRRFEGLELEAYDDGGGVLTIGFGHTGSDVYLGLKIDEEEAIRLLKFDLLVAEECVDESVEVQIGQCEFDALVSFVYNVGCKAFKSSTLLRLLNAGNKEAARAQFSRWNKDNGKVLAGLTNRRAAEAHLFGEGGNEEKFVYG